MKKRRQNRPEEPDLDRFEERGNSNGSGSGMTDPSIGDNAAGKESNGNGGGMSRAAKKRAKKRAKTNNTNSNSAAAPNNENGAGGNENKTKSKMQIPLDDDDDEDDDAAGEGGMNLMGAISQFRKKESSSTSTSSKKKKNKDKKKKKSDNNSNKEKQPIDDENELKTMAKDPPEEAVATAPAATGVSKSKGEMEIDENIMEEDDDDDDVDLEADEMEPELEALLATLTPLQILLLEDATSNNGDEDQKMPATQDDNITENGDANDADNKPTTDTGMQNQNGALAGIDPLQLIGDLTTKHRAKILLSSLLAPSGVTTHQFYERYWGKRPLLACLEEDESNEENNNAEDEKLEPEDEAIALNHSTRLNGFLHRPLIDKMIQRNKLRYGLDLNVTRFTDSMGNGLRHRITLDPPPKKRKSRSGEDGNDLEYIVANPKDVWSNVDCSHCSLRLLRPHEHNDNIHSMLSLLENEFGCMVGSNAYLTPLNSQGFAPHYDDVDVFILQLEGYKRWRVYAPFNKRETLPRESSSDYTEKEMEENGEELMDVILGPGDVLYLPRGWIHQAETVPRPSNIPKLPGMNLKDDHSLHLTVSAMQSWCWADFLEMLMPEALAAAAVSDKSISLREGLPRNFLSYTGTMHQPDDMEAEGLKQAAEVQKKLQEEDEVDEEALMEVQAKQRTLARQKLFKEEAKKRIMRVCKQAMTMLDDACDQMGKRYLSDRLPPALLEPERCMTKEGLSDSAAAAHHHDIAKKIWPNTMVRLARPDIARLVMEDDKAVLYHCLDNSRVFHGTPLSPMEFEVDDAPALEQLLTTVEPHWIMVKDLIHGDVEDKMEITQALFDEGLLATMLVETPDRSVQTG